MHGMTHQPSPSGDRIASIALRHRRRRAVAALALGAVTSLQPACYAYVPLQQQATPGDKVGLLVTDEGRIALREELGQGVDRVEGILLDKTGDDYLMRVARIRTIRGQTAHWTGEQVRIPLASVARVEQRKVSRRKTALLVAGLVAGAALLISTGTLRAFGFDSDDEPGGNGEPNDQ
jgi:hypothetical protein